VRERGNWRVSLSESTTEATFPPDTAAESAARAWVEARQACRTASQWDGPFLGSGERAASEVCGARGDVRLEPVRELVDDESAETFLAAFGGDVFSWARVVPVVAPTQLDLVLAPIGEQWFVIGAIQASPLVSG